MSLTGTWTQGGGTNLVGVTWHDDGNVTVLPICVNLDLYVSDGDEERAPLAVNELRPANLGAVRPGDAWSPRI